jgi:hypothetical protein
VLILKAMLLSELALRNVHGIFQYDISVHIHMYLSFLSRFLLCEKGTGIVRKTGSFLVCGINSSLMLLLRYEGKSRQSSAFTRNRGKPNYVLSLPNLLCIFVFFYMCALGTRGSVVG